MGVREGERERRLKMKGVLEDNKRVFYGRSSISLVESFAALIAMIMTNAYSNAPAVTVAQRIEEGIHVCVNSGSYYYYCYCLRQASI